MLLRGRNVIMCSPPAFSAGSPEIPGSARTVGRRAAALTRQNDRSMELLTAVLAILVAIAILFEVARRIEVPYPTLFVIGGLGLGFVPGIPRIELEPELILVVFLPPLLFT